MTHYSSSDPDMLLKRARDGDGLGDLLEVYRNYLKVLARLQIGRRLRGKVDDSDVVQEAFVQAQQTFQRFRGTTEREFLNWLRQVLSHVMAKLVRRFYGTERRDLRLEREMDEQLNRSSVAMDRALVDPHTSPSHQAVRREQAVLLADALEQLPDDYREVIELHHLEDLTFPEIARRMDRTIDSVKNLWLRALARLRRLAGETA